MPLLLHPSTAPEGRPHQFHPLHLCQQMMDPHSHAVQRALGKKIHTHQQAKPKDLHKKQRFLT